MRSTRYNTRSSEWAGDMTVWLRSQAGDNRMQLERLRRQLRRACERELTPCQKQALKLHYEEGLSVTEIARRLDVNPSTVSRTLRRAHERLRHFLQYAL